MARPKRKIPKGIPKNLEPLARDGERYRFNGFWLNETPPDRAIADWIDDQPNAAARIKSILFRLATGRAFLVPSEVINQGAQLDRRQIADSMYDPQFDGEDEIDNPFDEFDD